jgi:hypothetical protein
MAGKRTAGLMLPDPARLGEVALRDGEASELVRVRAPVATVAAFKALSPTERGAVVARGLASPPPDATPLTLARPAPAGTPTVPTRGP